MKISYQNKQIEKLCSLSAEMEAFFSHDKKLINGLQTLMGFFDQVTNLHEFAVAPYLKGYNLEKVKGTENDYSIRIIPKKRKSNYRMYLTTTNNGIEITIIKIDRHTYKL